MRVIQFLAVLTLLAALMARPDASCAQGVAIAIVYDTSGSMKEPVRDSSGNQTPKYVIANRALVAIAGKIEAFVTNAPAGEIRTVESALFVFGATGGKEAVPFGPFDAARIREWAGAFNSPNGGTPLGGALQSAAQKLLESPLPHKHVLVITDGNNTVGSHPTVVMPAIRKLSEQKQTSVEVHFVAFDVDSKIFEPLKRQGVTVVGAANELQLNTQLGFILENKILLEAEEPAKRK